MEISELPARLTLAQVLHYYRVKPDKNLRLCCPFHDDKTPSLQLYYKTHTAYCFSSNCKTHGKPMDVIDFIMNKGNCTKHEALKKATEMITGEGLKAAPPADRLTTLHKMFTYFKNAVHNSPPMQEYLQKRFIDFKQVEVGYNAGQFHHGARKDEILINECLKHGLLLDIGLTARTGDTAYKPFGNGVLCLH